MYVILQQKKVCHCRNNSEQSSTRLQSRSWHQSSQARSLQVQSSLPWGRSQQNSSAEDGDWQGRWCDQTASGCNSSKAWWPSSWQPQSQSLHHGLHDLLAKIELMLVVASHLQLFHSIWIFSLTMYHFVSTEFGFVVLLGPSSCWPSQLLPTIRTNVFHWISCLILLSSIFMLTQQHNRCTVHLCSFRIIDLFGTCESSEHAFPYAASYSYVVVVLCEVLPECAPESQYLRLTPTFPDGYALNLDLFPVNFIRGGSHIVQYEWCFDQQQLHIVLTLPLIAEITRGSINS